MTFLGLKPEVDEGQIGLYGTSYGGATVSWVGAVDQRARCIVSVVGIGHGQRWMSRVRRIDECGGKPGGLNKIAAALGEEPATIEDVYEPFLIQQGFLMRTPRGRQVTPRAYEHLGMVPPQDQMHLL